MIIIKLNGGLGNQLFQYSLGRSLSIKNNDVFKLDLSDFTKDNPRSYSLGHFNIVENLAKKEDVAKFNKKGLSKLFEKIKPYYKKSVIKYKGYDFDQNILKLSGNFYLDGYWQSEKYFKDIEGVIRKEITLKEPLVDEHANLINNIKNSNSVSVHIRRGDYATNKKFSAVYNLLDEEYYQRTVKFIAEKIKEPKFFIFSDDIKWAKQNLNIPYPKIFVSDNSEIKDYEELTLMSFCKHNIIANSSFSWWGAWLNTNIDKIVLSPDKWFNIGVGNTSDLIPEDWIKL
ncbi:MAG: alpha-1,2-fucosyltransferase [Patescibacteria group bacterium]